LTSGEFCANHGTVARQDHACLLSVSEEQRAEVAALFTRTNRRAVFVGDSPDWLLRRLREDGRGPVLARPGPPSCGALATLSAHGARLCVYENSVLSGEQRRGILDSHGTAVVAPAVFDDGVLRVTLSGDGLRLAGETDVSNRHGLVAAMISHEPEVIDMRSLRFIDAGTVTAMYATATRRIRLWYPQPVPRRVIELFDPKAERLVCEGVGSG
jgi:hypothetical protein